MCSFAEPDLATRCHYEDTRSSNVDYCCFSTTALFSLKEQALRAQHDNEAGTCLPGKHTRGTRVDTTTFNFLVVSTPPDTGQRYDATQSPSQLAHDHFPHEHIAATESTSNDARLPADKRGHRDLTTSRFSYARSTRTKEALPANQLSELD